MRDVLVRGTAWLRRRGVPEARLDAELLLAHTLGVDRAGLYRDFSDSVDRSTRSRYAALLRKRRRRLPVAYLTGWREFYGLPFAVGPGVLVPRPETETLVDAVLESRSKERAWRMLDVGTGAGTIAVAVGAHDPRVRIAAIEPSERALEYARRNAAMHAVGRRIHWIARDFRDCAGRFGAVFDVVASNPPYVVPVETPLVDELAHEPRAALYGDGIGFPEFYRELARAARSWLRQEGSLMVEVGAGQADEVAAIFRDAGLVAIAIHADLSGVGRVVSGKLPSRV